MKGEAGDRVLVKRNQVAGYAVDDDFEDSASGAGDDGRAAGHGFEVDDAEGLIDRWAAEDAAVAVELDGLGFGEHLLDPYDARVNSAEPVDFLAHLGSDLGRIGSAGAEDNLRLRRQVRDGIDQMGNALLAGDTPDEEDIGPGGIDTVLDEGRGAIGLLILLKVDAVVDHVDAVGVDLRVGAQDVGSRALGDGDHGVGIENRSALHPGTHDVAAAELLGLPCAQRFETVGGKDKGDVVELLCEESGHRDVPGVGVDDVDGGERRNLGEVEAEGLESGFEFFLGAIGNFGPGLGTPDMEVAFVGELIAPAVDFDLDGLCELAAEVLNVDACATVNKGWVLSGHQADAQGSLRDEFHLTAFPKMLYLIEVTGVRRLAEARGRCVLRWRWTGIALDIDRGKLPHACDSVRKMQKLGLTES